ncbi:hypothetical protein [Candidatus Phycosocius spiralis]|uniref:HPt domain-containing protein n=1 Tax=Candidatus Phycosocius spiralis TaxID=2815099 RepID=A0ABQ4PUE3_9PROT|nr:hypothetical protein [Candidatus Phycosocius spiralis]GIU66599.1 hypothetical protein PsB1_0753 [Candidatus Phycosocius spiralis]
MSLNTPAQLTPPSFRLQRLVGEPAANVLTSEVYYKAEMILAEMIPPLVLEVHRLLEEISETLENGTGNIRDLIWDNAHEIRGLAGSVGKVYLGLAANLICQYLQDTQSDFIPDQEVMQTIIIIAFQALRDDADTDPMMKVLVQDGARAILAQRHREGRE